MTLNISLIFNITEKIIPPLSLEIRQTLLADDDIKLGPVQDLREKLEEMERPWLSPGVDMKDYFNYGLNEQTFQMHQEKLRVLRIFSEFLNRSDNKNKRVKLDTQYSSYRFNDINTTNKERRYSLKRRNEVNLTQKTRRYSRNNERLRGRKFGGDIRRDDNNKYTKNNEREE